MQTKLPESINKKFYIHAIKYDWDDSTVIHVAESDLSATAPAFILLGTQDVVIKVPKIDIVAAEIKGLENFRTKLLAETEIKQQRITDKIQSLLCIDHK